MKIDSIVKFVTGNIRLRGATDQTLIGNKSNRLLVDSKPDLDSVPLPVYKMLMLSGSEAMNVDGSVSTKTFEMAVPSGETHYLTDLAVIIQDTGLPQPDRFGGNTALTNGVLVRLVLSSVNYDIFVMKNNMHLGLFFGDNPQLPASGWYDSNDTFGGSFTFPSPVKMSAGDKAQIIIRDNLTAQDHFRASTTAFRYL